MKQINITRDSSGNVVFQTVSVDTTENVCFTNLDPKSAHWPTLTTNQLGPAPSPNSSQCTVPPPAANQTKVTYGCKITGHEKEQGVINVFPQLAAVTPPTPPTSPPSPWQATVNKPLPEQQVVKGGMGPYVITDQLFQVTDKQNKVIKSGSGIGPGLNLKTVQDKNGFWGIWVVGTPTLSGTYNFTFTVNDAMGRNLQQVQYKLIVN